MAAGEDGPIRNPVERVLSHVYGRLSSTSFEYRRRDGTWQRQTREAYDRGNGAAILPYDPARGTVLLVRQFRFPAWLNHHPEPLIEAIAGVLDEHDPLTAVSKEAEEEAGFRIRAPRRIYEAFMSPGAVTETLSFFVAEYSPADRIGAGGGLADEGEDIEVLELDFQAALAMTRDGRIVDAKTIMLLQYLRLDGLL